MKDKIRIASGHGFWGDWFDAPYYQVTNGPIDYLVMDYLAEVTMSIMQKQKQRNPARGYATDFVNKMQTLLPLIVEKDIKVITNAGGVNPEGCYEALIQVAEKLNISGVKVGIVSGDNIKDRIDDLQARGIHLNNMDTDEPIDKIRDCLLTANVYFGADAMVQALAEGAQIIVTGRVTDTGLTLAPMIHEFGWDFDDWDKVAAGTVAGHILECGAQSSGGNFQGGWEDVPDMANIGYPIAEAFPDGTVVITKHENSGGLVNVASVTEQLLYEIGDPKDYITPDVIADFTSIQLEQEGPNRVKVFGVKGQPKTDMYKVSVAYADGWKATGQLTYAWPKALKKAQLADQILRKRLEISGLKFDEIRTEFVGVDACHGPLSTKVDDDCINEVVLRISVRGHKRADVARFGAKIAPLILNGPPTVTGFAGGRPKPSEIAAFWPALIPKTEAKPIVEVKSL